MKTFNSKCFIQFHVIHKYLIHVYIIWYINYLIPFDKKKVFLQFLHYLKQKCNIQLYIIWYKKCFYSVLDKKYFIQVHIIWCMNNFIQFYITWYHKSRVLFYSILYKKCFIHFLFQIPCSISVNLIRKNTSFNFIQCYT